MKKLLSTLLICAVTFTLVGCGKTPTLKDGKKVIASVKGEKISVEELYEKLKDQGGESVLISMIDKHILNKEIKTDEDAKSYANSQIQSYKESYKKNNQDFNSALKQAGYEDEDAFKDDLIIDFKKQKVTENYIKDGIKDEEIDKYYKNNIYGDIEAKHILISPDSSEDATDAEKTKAEKKAKEQAEKIIKMLKNGQKFDDLAKKYSDDKGTAKKGGKLTVTYGEVVDEFWNATEALKDKTYTTEPVKTEYGYHIIYRISQADKPKLKDVKDDILDKLVSEKKEKDSTLETKAMVELRKKYDMKINDSDLNDSYNKAIQEALDTSKNATTTQTAN